MWHCEPSNTKNWDRKLSGRIIFVYLIHDLYPFYFNFFWLHGTITFKAGCVTSPIGTFEFFLQAQNMCFLLHPKDIPCKHFKCKSSSLDIHHYLATEYAWATKFRLILFFGGIILLCMYYFWSMIISGQ